MAEVKVILGTKLSEQEQRNVDRTKAVWLTAQPPPGFDVVGQDDNYSWRCVVCPYCGCVGCVTAALWEVALCHCCGRLLRTHAG